MTATGSIEDFQLGKQGVYKDVPFGVYASLKAVSSSALKLMERSPLHFRYNYINPRKDTSALSLGRMTHLAIFEPEAFKQYAVMPKFDGRTTVGKADKAKWISEHEGMLFVEQDEYNTAVELRDSVFSHPTAKRILEIPSEHELSIVWNDPITGVLCKGRIDRYTAFVYKDGESEPVVIDLKTCQDARPKAFSRSIFEYKYYFSLAFYLRGLQTILGKTHNKAVIIAVETPNPHGVNVQQLNNGWLYNGFQEIDKYLAEFKRCEEANVWDGYTTDILESSPASYMFEIQ